MLPISAKLAAKLLMNDLPFMTACNNDTAESNAQKSIPTSAPEPYLSVDDYDYHLPESLIARYPLESRSASKLLYVAAAGELAGQPQDFSFQQLPSLLNSGDLIVFNDTKVMKARLFGQKDTGGKIEVLVERIIEDASQLTDANIAIPNEFSHLALCHVKASKAPKLGQKLEISGGEMQAVMVGRQENLFILAFKAPILPDLERFGELPIPPYFERHADDVDNERYQTVFHDPSKLASVAAPTASLHFDDNVLQALKDKGIQTAFVTLHVGAGTFAPVKTDNLLEHTMHSEFAQLPQETADLINQTHANGGRVIAVGTTVTRVLESAFQKTAINGAPLSAWSGDTDIFIYPGFRFGVIDKLLTNFHLPKSTLLMLVSAFSGKKVIESAYQHAITQNYRFFSYGDAMLLDRAVVEANNGLNPD